LFFMFAFPSIGSRVGILTQEVDGGPAATYVYNIKFPNGTYSITGNVGTLDLDALFAAKAPLASPTFTGTVTIPTPFTLGAVSVTATGTQLNYVDATGPIQAQIDGKQATVTEGSLTDSVVVSADIKDGTIANADVAADAAIDGTKLNITSMDISGTGTDYVLMGDSSGDHFLEAIPPATALADMKTARGDIALTAFDPQTTQVGTPSTETAYYTIDGKLVTVFLLVTGTHAANGTNPDVTLPVAMSSSTITGYLIRAWCMCISNGVIRHGLVVSTDTTSVDIWPGDVDGDSSIGDDTNNWTPSQTATFSCQFSYFKD